MDLCSELCSSGQMDGQPAGHLSVLHGKNLNVGHYTQMVKPVFFSYLPCL